MTTIEDVGADLSRLAGIIGAPRGLLPALGPADGADAPTRLDVLNDGSLAYTTAERGQVTRQTTHDRDELLYWVFVPVCFNMAMPWESMHRVPAIDFRAVMFARELHLLGRLDRAWPDRYRPHLIEVLRRHPYVGEDPSKAAASVRAYHADYRAEFAPSETDALERIGRRLAVSEEVYVTDTNTLRRLTVYVGLIARGVPKDEARTVSSYVLVGLY